MPQRRRLHGSDDAADSQMLAIVGHEFDHNSAPGSLQSRDHQVFVPPVAGERPGELLHNKLQKPWQPTCHACCTGGPLFSRSCSGTQSAVLHEPLNIGGEVNVRTSFFI